MRSNEHRSPLSLLRGEGTRARLLRGAAGSILIAGSARVLSLGTSIILARTLAPAGYGVYAFAISVMGLLQIPAQFGLDQLLSRELAANEASERWDLARGVLRRAIQLVSLSTVIISVITLAVLWLAPLGLGQQKQLTLTVGVAFMVINACAIVASATLAGLRHVVIAQLPMQVGRPALFLAGVAGIWLLAEQHLNPITAMATNTTASVAMLAGLVMLARRLFCQRAAHVAPRFETRRWLGSALLFSFIAGLGTINSQTDIVMLGLMSTSYSVGIYRVAIAAAGLIPMVLIAVNNAIGPTLARLNSTGNRPRLALVARVAAFSGLAGGLALILVFAIWGQPLIKLIYGAPYLIAWTPLMILALGQCMNAGMGPVGLVLNMTGHERDAFSGLAIAAAVNVVLNAILIPLIGTIGAAAATAVSTVVWNVLMTWRVRRQLGFIPLSLGRLPS